MTEVYISVDVEAAGPIPGDYSLLSIGACVVGHRERRFAAQLRPLNGRFVPEAIRVSGLSLAALERDGEDPALAMERFESWILDSAADASPVFVGLNASFDWSFVNWYFHHFIGRNPFGIGALDSKSFFMGLRGCTWDDTRSSRLPAPLASLLEHSHDALEDALCQARLFEALLQESRS